MDWLIVVALLALAGLFAWLGIRSATAKTQEQEKTSLRAEAERIRPLIRTLREHANTSLLALSSDMTIDHDRVQEDVNAQWQAYQLAVGQRDTLERNGGTLEQYRALASDLQTIHDELDKLRLRAAVILQFDKDRATMEAVNAVVSQYPSNVQSFAKRRAREELLTRHAKSAGLYSSGEYQQAWTVLEAYASALSTIVAMFFVDHIITLETCPEALRDYIPSIEAILERQQEEAGGTPPATELVLKVPPEEGTEILPRWTPPNNGNQNS